MTYTCRTHDGYNDGRDVSLKLLATLTRRTAKSSVDGRYMKASLVALYVPTSILLCATE
jgi:hypothetical protein